MASNEDLIYSERDVQTIINEHFINKAWIAVMMVATIPICAFGGWVISSANESMHIQKQLVEAQLELIETMKAANHPNPGELQRLRQELIKRQGQ